MSRNYSNITPNKKSPDQLDTYSRKWLILSVVSVGIFISCMDSSMVSIATPAIANSMGILPQTAQWVVTAYLLCITATLLLFGRVGDLIGGKQIYSLGFLIFALGSGLSSQADSIWSLAFCRAFQALGASMLMSTGMGIVTTWFPTSQRGQALGITGTVVAIGTLTGPILGGIIVGTWNWHAIFYLNIFLGIIGFFLAYHYLPTHSPFAQIKSMVPHSEVKSFPLYRQRFTTGVLYLRQELDLIGFGFFALGMVGLLLALGQGPSWGWQNPLTIIIGSSGIVCLAIFFRWEQKIPFPLLDLELFQNWTFTSGILTAILVYAVSIFVSFWIPFYLEQVLLLPPQKMGLVMSAIPLTMGIISPTSGWLSDRIDYRYLTGIGLIIATFSLVNLSFLGTSALPTRVAVGLGIFGLGVAIFNSPNNSSVMGSAPLPKLGIAGGVVATGRNLGMVLGVTLSSAVFTYFSNRYALTIPSPVLETGPSLQIFSLSLARVFQAAAFISAVAAGISIIKVQKTDSKCINL